MNIKNYYQLEVVPRKITTNKITYISDKVLTTALEK